MKQVSFLVTLEVPDGTDDTDVLFELRSYLPDIDTSGTWRLADVRQAERECGG